MTVTRRRTRLPSVPVSGGTFTGEIVALDFKATGLAGAVQPSRYVGCTAGGAPVAGTFAVGDFVITQLGGLYVCSVAGTPGTWIKANLNIIDAKGDLIVGTADNTATRLAVGNDGQMLLADTSAAEGQSWRLPQFVQPPAIGDYCETPHITRAVGAPVLNSEYMTPLWLPGRYTFDRIGVEVTTHYAATAFRLGVHAHNFATGRPGVVLFDAGTVGTASAAAQEITINQAVGPGLVWIAGAAQTAVGALQVRRMASAAFQSSNADTARAYGSNPVSIGYIATGVAGAFADNPVCVSSTNAPLFWLRRSA